MFTATQFSTIEDKEKFANHFKKFVLSDFERSKFPKWFYNRLSITFGMIAHYNQEGFYDTFFDCNGRKVHFLKRILDYPCYGDSDYTFSDVEKYLQEWVRDNEILNKYIEVVKQEINLSEHAEYERLRLKFEGNNQ
jgi:hypothetical protein